jgi:hypothetical protein
MMHMRPIFVALLMVKMMINHWTELVTLRFMILRSMGTRLKTHAGDDFISMPPGLCFTAAWESPCEAYHQYLVEHPEAVLAHHQPHCPNASGVRICTGSGGLAVDHGDLTVTLAEELDLTCGALG